MNFINPRWEYLTVLLVCVVLPLLFTIFHPRIRLRNNWQILIISLIISAIPFLIWDYFATKFSHWSFNPDFILGIYIFNLPLEEVLFFFAIPFCCHFLWSIIDNFENWPKFWQDLFLR